MGKKSIYKITNNINGKIYIGQSNNPERRFKEHIRDECTSLIHNAIKLYGVENFTLNIIEKDIENYNEREKYWILFYKSNKRGFGYNITDGGEEPPILKGENSLLCKYSDKVIKNIQKDLYEGIKTYEEISKEYLIPVEYLSFINRGITRVNEDYSYPIRQNGNERLSSDMVFDIALKLLYSNDSIEKIARDRKIDSNTIYTINKGDHFHCPKEITYPIRDKYSRYSRFLIFNIIQELKNQNYTFYQIQNMYNISKSLLYRINNGISYKQDNMKYPIRPSNKRVYKPVETIPS